MKILPYLMLFIILLIPAMFVISFIDRVIISSTGFKDLMDYLFIFMCACILPMECILGLMKVFPNTLGSSMFSLLIILHISAFFISSSIIVSFYYITLWVDYISKTKFKILKFNIISSNQIYYKSIFKDSKFIKFQLVLSYFISTIVLLFIIPIILSNKFKDSSLFSTLYLPEIKTYQCFFVFTLLPILFSYIKKQT